MFINCLFLYEKHIGYVHLYVNNCATTCICTHLFIYIYCEFQCVLPSQPPSQTQKFTKHTLPVTVPFIQFSGMIGGFNPPPTKISHGGSSVSICAIVCYMMVGYNVGPCSDKLLHEAHCIQL